MAPKQTTRNGCHLETEEGEHWELRWEQTRIQPVRTARTSKEIVERNDPSNHLRGRYQMTRIIENLTRRRYQTTWEDAIKWQKAEGACWTRCHNDDNWFNVCKAECSKRKHQWESRLKNDWRSSRICGGPPPRSTLNKASLHCASKLQCLDNGYLPVH